jgi:tetratricopeptide (TPR) repeat protein
MRRRGALILMLVFVCLGIAAQSTEVEKGLELFRQQRYAEALHEFDAASFSHPGNAVIENFRGIAATQLGRTDDANQYYGSAIRLNAKFEDPHKNLGFNYLNTRHYELAEQELKRALAIDARDPYAHFYLAMLYLATSNDKAVAEQVTPSWSLLGNDPDVSLQMAKACLRVDQVSHALAIVDLLRQQSKLSTSREKDFATSLYAKGLYSQAAEQFRRVAASDPESWVNQYNLAIALINAKSAGEGTSLLEKLLIERPKDRNILSLLGSVYESDNKIELALETYKKEVPADPLNPDSYLDYSRLLMDQARYEESEQFVRQGLESAREPYPLFVRLGSIQMLASSYEDARKWFQKAIDEHDEISVGYVAMAQSFFKERRDEPAVKILESGRAKVKPDFLLEYFYGLALDRLQRKTEALAAFKRAARLNADVADIHYELGRLYLDLGRIPEAQKELEQVLRMSPRHSKATFQLSRVYMRLGDKEEARRFSEQTQRLKRTERDQDNKIDVSHLASFQPIQSQ